MNRIIDRHYHNPDLNACLKQFVLAKAQERPVWAEITGSCHRMLGGRSPWIERIATATEIMLLALDIADDLQDRDNLGKSWMTCPQEISINALLSFIFAVFGELGELQGIEGSGNLPALDGVCRYITGAVNGQHRDLTRSIASEQDYIAAVLEKSGSLLKLACYMGCSCLEHCDPKLMADMDEMAGWIGVAAQLDNDLKDVLRYDVKNDLLEKKMTLPILFLLQHSEEDFPMLKQYYNGEIDRATFLAHKRQCIQYIVDSGCIEYCLAVQTLFVNRIETMWGKMDTLSPWKEAFREATFASFRRSADSYIAAV
jgi:competence protein ComQ